MTNSRNRAAYQAWVRSVVAPAFERTERRRSPGTTVEAERLGSAFMMALGIAGRDSAVLRDARRRVDAFLRGNKSIPSTLVDTLIFLAALEGDAALYDAYLERSRTAATPEQRYRFLYALAAFRDPALLARTVEHAMSARLRTQDRPRLLAAILDNPAGREAAWAAIRGRWEDLEATLEGFGGTSRIIEGLDAFCDLQRASEIETFFGSHAPDGARRTLAQMLERIRICAALASAEQPRLDRWLATDAVAPGTTREHPNSP